MLQTHAIAISFIHLLIIFIYKILNIVMGLFIRVILEGMKQFKRPRGGGWQGGKRLTFGKHFGRHQCMAQYNTGAELGMFEGRDIVHEKGHVKNFKEDTVVEYCLQAHKQRKYYGRFAGILALKINDSVCLFPCKVEREKWGGG